MIMVSPSAASSCAKRRQLDRPVCGRAHPSAHAVLDNPLVVVPGASRVYGQEPVRLLAGVDAAVRPARRNVPDDAGRHLDPLVTLAVEQQQPALPGDAEIDLALPVG